MSEVLRKRPGWRSATLQDLVFFQRGYDITKAEQKPGDIPVVSSSGINSYHSESKVDGPGVVIGRKGSLGTIHYVEGPYWPHDTTLWSKDLKGNHTRFVYYFLHTMGLERYDVGSSNPTLNRNHIHGLDITMPDYWIQERIVEVLSAYDDLIENNRQRVQLLEKAAQLLYKEWFVHLRFPGHEHVKIKDGVPDGWEKQMVTSHLEFVRGVEPGSKNYMAATDEGRVPFLRVGDFGSRSSNIYIDATLAKGKMLEPEDMAITMDGTPGLVSLGMKGAFSSGIRKVVPKEQCGIGWSFIYELLQSDAIQSTVERFAKGTTILHASSSLNHMVFLKPTETLLDLFEDTTAPVLRQILLLNDQNQQLSQARDILLPRLMNGKVAV